MFLGSAILLAVILYLVDRNKVWRQFLYIAGPLCLVGMLCAGGLFGWQLWQAHREKASARQADITPNAAQDPVDAKVVELDESRVTPGKKPKRFGNATVESDTAVMMNGRAFITTLSHPARVMVLGEKDSKYQVRLADGRAGEMDMNDIRRDSIVVISKARHQTVAQK